MISLSVVLLKSDLKITNLPGKLLSLLFGSFLLLNNKFRIAGSKILILLFTCISLYLLSGITNSLKINVKIMQLNLITNSGVRNLHQELSEQLKIANTVNIATAFITKEGIDLLKIFLKSNKNKFRHCKLLTGLYHYFNLKECHSLNGCTNYCLGRNIFCKFCCDVMGR